MGNNDHIQKIYTKKGDKGKSSTIAQKNIKKTKFVFFILGTLDELNSLLGIVKTIFEDEQIDDNETIQKIQIDLFNIGTEISKLKSNRNWKLRIQELENAIDATDVHNVPIKHFVLPGGRKASAYLHYARAVCRKAERLYLMWFKSTKVFRQLDKEQNSLFSNIGVYLNRLSDFLFVLARYHNEQGRGDFIYSDTLIKK